MPSWCLLACICFVAQRVATGLKFNSSTEKIVFLLRTGGYNSADHIKAIKETWGKHLSWGPNGRIVPFVEDPDCKQKYGNNHGFGLTCLESHNELELLSRNDFEFVFIIDDDVYVNVDNLEQAIMKHQVGTNMTWGIPGCGKCESGRKSGFCGGGGYLVPRHNLALMASKPSRFLEEFNREPDQVWCDVRFACVAQLHNLSLEPMNGLYGWAFQSTTEEDKAIRSKEVPPLTFHYASPERMRDLHKKFQQPSLLQLGAGVEDGLTTEEYSKQMHEYIQSEQKQRANM